MSQKKNDSNSVSLCVWRITLECQSVRCECGVKEFEQVTVFARQTPHQTREHSKSLHAPSECTRESFCGWPAGCMAQVGHPGCACAQVKLNSLTGDRPFSSRRHDYLAEYGHNRHDQYPGDYNFVHYPVHLLHLPLIELASLFRCNLDAQ